MNGKICSTLRLGERESERGMDTQFFSLFRIWIPGGGSFRGNYFVIKSLRCVDCGPESNHRILVSPLQKVSFYGRIMQLEKLIKNNLLACLIAIAMKYSNANFQFFAFVSC